MLRILIIIIICTFAVQLSAQISDTSRFYFQTNSAKLEKEQETALATLARSIRNSGKILIYGHTDTTGTAGLNDRLALSRAAYTRDVLLRNGVQKENIDISGFGEKEPYIATDLDKNRRVEVIFEASDIQDLYKLLGEKPDRFTIDANRDTFLISSNGTILDIPANAFKTNKNEKVQLVLTEFFTRSSIVANNLSTTSNEEILETGGMIHLVAIQGSDTLNPYLDKPIRIDVPTEEKLPDMELFLGERDNNNFVDWQIPIMDWAFLFGDMDSLISMQRDTVPYQQLSNMCDSLINMDKQALQVPEYNFLQKIFTSRSKRSTKAAEIEDLKASVDSCAALNKRIISFNEDEKNKRQEFVEAYKMEMERRKRNMELYGQWFSSYNRFISESENRGKDAFEGKDTGTTNIRDVARYVFSIPKLGFVNIDRFSKIPGPRYTFNAFPGGTNSDAKLVFKSLRVILPYNGVNGGIFQFHNIPEGFEVVLVGLKYENKQPMLYMKEFTTSSSMLKARMDFKPVTLEELQKELKKLDDI